MAESAEKSVLWSYYAYAEVRIYQYHKNGSLDGGRTKSVAGDDAGRDF